MSADTNDTVTHAAALRALAERVEAGKVTRYWAIMHTMRTASVPAEGRRRINALMMVDGYLDAVAALQEVVLSGWRMLRVEVVLGVPRVHLVDPRRPEEAFQARGVAPTLCQAWLAALLRALAMEAERG